jgi:hypothetical protein
LTLAPCLPYHALVIHRVTLYQPDPKRAGKDRKWRTFEREAPSLLHAIAFIYRELERTNPELVERISAIDLLCVRGAQVPVQ